MDFLQVFRETKAIGYDGLYNYEIPGERKAPLEIRAHKLDYIQKITQYLDQNS